MSFFSGIVGSMIGPIVDKIIGPFTDLFKSYLNKQITIEELRAKMTATMLESFTAVEKSHSETLASTYKDFQESLRSSLLVKVVWASVTISQLLVLLWHQVGISTLCYFVGNKACWPSSGETVVWAYALVGASVGLGPLVLRVGPGSAAFDKFKELIKK